MLVQKKKEVMLIEAVLYLYTCMYARKLYGINYIGF